MGREIHIPGEVTYEKFRSKTNDMFWAAVLIANSDVHLFSDLKRELANAYTKGKNDYPLTMLGAYELLLNYQGNEDEQSLKTKLTELVSESESEDNNTMVLEDTYMLVKRNPSETKQPMAKSRTIVIFTLEDNMGKRKVKRISRIAGYG